MKPFSSRFERFLDQTFKRRMKTRPVEAAMAGLKSGEGQLDPCSTRDLKAAEQARRRTLDELDAFSPTQLSSEQRLDALALRSLLTRESEDYEWGRHRKDPQALESILNILLHELQRGEDEPRRAARNIRSLLSRIPRNLRDAARLLDRPERVWVKIMKQTETGSASLFQAVNGFLSRQSSSASDQALVKAAQAAFARYSKAVQSRKTAAPNSFSIGADRLQRRVRDELGLDYTLGEIEALALDEIDRINGLMKDACRRFKAGRAPTGFIERARCNWSPPEDLLRHYTKETNRIARAFRRAKAMSFPPGESLKVRPVPEFMRHLFPLAAYSAPGPFDKKQEGSFWVNDLSLIKKTNEEKRAERQQHFGVSLTAAHEAYPGHHLQFTTANRHPRKWRPMFAHAIFYEGWTLWCEHQLIELKVETAPAMQLQQLHDALWRCHRILVDLRLHTGRYSYRAAVNHMVEHLGMTRARAEADVNWYTQCPAVPMSYWLGRLENERLKRRLIDGQGWSLKRFNDWLLSFGTLPQSWIEKYGL